MKTYILTIDKNTDPIVEQHTHRAIESCEKHGMPWELLYGPNKNLEGIDGGVACKQGHERVWKKIINDGEAAVLFEHDGYWLKPLDFTPKSDKHFYNLTCTRLGHGQIISPYTAELFCGIYDRWGYCNLPDTVYNMGAPLPIYKDKSNGNDDMHKRRQEMVNKYYYCINGVYVGGNNGYSFRGDNYHTKPVKDGEQYFPNQETWCME